MTLIAKAIQTGCVSMSEILEYVGALFAGASLKGALTWAAVANDMDGSLVSLATNLPVAAAIIYVVIRFLAHIRQKDEDATKVAERMMSMFDKASESDKTLALSMEKNTAATVALATKVDQLK